MRTWIVAASPALRAGMRALLAHGPAIDIVGEARGLDELEDLVGLPDLLVVAGDEVQPRLLGRLADRADAPALLVVGGPADLPARLAGLSIHAWAVLPEDAGEEELVAAASALAQGLVVLSPQAVQTLGAVAGRPLADPLAADQAGEPLTPREAEVLAGLARGLANKQIASELGISENTVKYHVSSIYTKLDAMNRAQAVRIGVRRGLITI